VLVRFLLSGSRRRLPSPKIAATRAALVPADASVLTKSGKTKLTYCGVSSGVSLARVISQFVMVSSGTLYLFPVYSGVMKANLQLTQVGA